MEEPVVPVSLERTRKRGRNPSDWQRAKKKALRYSAKRLPQYPTCNHERGAYQCRKLTMTDIRKYFESFYATNNKIQQDAFLLQYCKVSDTLRHRARVGQRAPNNYSTKLFIKTSNRLKLIPVCQKTFLHILHISVHRIRRVAKVFKTTGGAVKKTRGGDHTSHKYLSKKLAVKRFIESFKCLESHYCRSSVVRKYLNSNLNIRKMWKMYDEQLGPEEQVKESYFRDVFNSDYNIGFGSPRTDVCSKCTELDEKIKSEKDVHLKNTFIIQKRVHKLKAKVFYKLLREEKEGMVTLSFDCQKNQVLPKVPDQIAYYSRQLYIYNFAIVKSQPDNFGTAINFDMDLDWKSAMSSVLKPPGSWHFPFSLSKRFFIKRGSNNKITIKGEINYCSEMVYYKSILKREQSFKNFVLAQISKNKVKINPAKLEDVEMLLKKHFGSEWQTRCELQYYKEVLAASRSASRADTEDTDDMCEPSPLEIVL